MVETVNASRWERRIGMGLAAIILTAGATACSESEPTLFQGTVVNYLDKQRLNVGVRTYQGPNSNAEAGWQAGNARPYVDCIAPGRTVTDTDVPANTPPTVSQKWLRIVADPQRNSINPQWIGDGYFAVQTPGTVPNCTPAQIDNKNLPNIAG